MRQPSVGCVGVELFKELKRQRDVDVRICTWRGPCRCWLEHLFSGWWVSPLTCSHHYDHHRSHLIKALPPWLTPRLPAHEREERGEQTWTVQRIAERGGGVIELRTKRERCKPDWEGCWDATKNSCKALQLVCIIYHTEPWLTGMCDEKCLVESSSGLSTRLHSGICKWNIGTSCNVFFIL